MEGSLISTNECCRICDASATYKNFGIYTCFSCKVFFKRHAEKTGKTRKCSYGGDCQINIHQRRTCTACRLEKCLRNGMQRERLRPSRTQVTHHQVSKSLLNADQWILLSNLIHCYDHSKLSLTVQRLIVEERKGRIDSNLLRKVFIEIHQTTLQCLCSNADFYNLCSEDRSSLLRSAIENVNCLSWALIWTRSQISQCHSFCHYLERLYQEGSLPIIKSFIKFLDPDTVLVQLALSLFAFSNNSLIFSPTQSIERTNPMAIWKIENSYAELTWKYLLNRNGHYGAILRFNKLIQCLLAATVSISEAQGLQLHNNLIDYAVEKTELSLLLDDIERL